MNGGGFFAEWKGHSSTLFEGASRAAAMQADETRRKEAFG